MLPSAGHCFSLHHIMALELRALHAHAQQHPEVSVGGEKKVLGGISADCETHTAV